MNCLWITVDSFRQDHVNCYRPEGTLDPTGPSLKVHTPNLDKLASEGVRFNRLRSEALPTVPCRRGSYTGRRVFPWVEEPTCKGEYIAAPGWRPIPQDDVTVAEHLSEQGYVCGLVADVYHLMKPSQNFHRGFQSYQWERGQEYDQWQSQPLPDGYLDRYLKPGTHASAYRNRVLVQYLKNQMFRCGEEDYQSPRTFRRALEWLERNHAHESFFLCVESFDPHEPFETPQRYIDLYDPDWDGPELIYANLYKRDELTDREHLNVRARYAALCTMVDHWVGKLLDAVERLGLRENTLVVLTSDHGKTLGEFGAYGMPQSSTGPCLSSVPCLVRHPGGEHAGMACDGWLYNTDLACTMLSLLDVEPKPRTDGREIWSALSGTGDGFREFAVVGHVELVSCWQGDWLYLLNTNSKSAALYNLAEDIHREHDVADKYPSVRADLKRKLEQVAERGD
jgi:arylsulfatase A-like enzyme